MIPYLLHKLLQGRLCHVLAHVPICVIALPKVKGVGLIIVLMTREFADALRLVLHLLLGEDHDLQPGLVMSDGCHGDGGLCSNALRLTHCQAPEKRHRCSQCTMSVRCSQQEPCMLLMQ